MRVKEGASVLRVSFCSDMFNIFRGSHSQKYIERNSKWNWIRCLALLKTVNRRNRCNLSFSSLYFRSHHACMLSAFEPLFETVGPHCVYKVSISDGEMYERSAECPLSASKTQRSVLFKLLTYFMDTNLISAVWESAAVSLLCSPFHWDSWWRGWADAASCHILTNPQGRGGTMAGIYF